MHQKITCTVYSDPAHSWGKTALKYIHELGLSKKISPFSYVKGDYIYLEEDCDLPRFLDACKANGIAVTIKENPTSSKMSRIRSYYPYTGAVRAMRRSWS